MVVKGVGMSQDIAPTSIAVVGVGKIARDQHLPALAAHPDFSLEALVSLDDCGIDLPCFRTVTEMAAAMPHIQAVSICTPPDCRLDIVAQALAANLHVMLEKPTAATVAKAMAIEAMAKGRPQTLFASWHSRQAAGVGIMREWLKSRQVLQVDVSWKEDIRVWHPGQNWIFSSGFGVFDPAINAFSILTEILEDDFFFAQGEIVVPRNKTAPIAADLVYRFADRDGGIRLELDFDRRTADPEWSIAIRCACGSQARLEQGGARVVLPSHSANPVTAGEYTALYSHFAELIARGENDFDLSPMIHVFDAMALSHRRQGGTFDW